ncbi:MAG: L-ribulose-5-phosphate 4-epimerase [Bacilli bacterium]|nr:L-ribulose-5-phosphate 4-epimerase [Bacilli bacterium]
MLEELKKEVWETNLSLKRHGLIILTWGNASGIDREKGLMVIKPSGVPYETMQPSDMVVMDLEGKVIEGNLKPSSDAKTHIELYKAFPKIGSIIHTHSTYATCFAQAGMEIPPLGTTHADLFHGPVPITRELSLEEVNEDYEGNTGKVIIERFANLDYLALPGVLAKNHGPFVWGHSPKEALVNALTLEEIAKMAYLTLSLNKNSKPMQQYLLDKHYERKHGPKAYYGQKRR